LVCFILPDLPFRILFHLFWNREANALCDSGDVPMEDEVMKQVVKVVREAGVKLPQDSAGETEDGSQLDGWDGGVVWLVPTDRPVSEWKPIATRVL
jgi:hypothetical protein